MKAFWFAHVPIEEVMRMLLRRLILPTQGKITKSGRKTFNLPATGEALLLWDVDPKDFGPPSVMIASPLEIEALLPKLFAIPGALASVCSFTRIWTTDAASFFFRREPSKLSNYCLSGLIGIIIFELLVRLGPKADFRRIGMGTVERTFSFACSTLISKGGWGEELEDLIKAWRDASNVTANEIDNDLLQAIIEMVKFVEFLNGPYSSFDGDSLALAKYIDEKIYSDTNRSHRTSLVERVEQLKGESREKQFAMVEIFVGQLLEDESIGRVNAGLSCGYLLTQLDTTSSDFFEFALEVNNGDFAIACSYLMCLGLINGADFFWKADGLGFELARVLRAKNSTHLDACPDLSLSELRILRSKVADDGFHFRTKNPTEVEVELIPDITATFSNGIRRGASVQRALADGAEYTQIQQVRQSLKRLTDLSTVMRSELAHISEEIAENRSKQKKFRAN
jgi:hypothetical protein